jgi:hypothetical protein
MIVMNINHPFMNTDSAPTHAKLKVIFSSLMQIAFDATDSQIM